MNLSPTNLSLVALTLLSAAASAVALARLRAAMQAVVAGPWTGADAAGRPAVLPRAGWLNAMVGGVALGSAGLLGWRWARLGGWNPLTAHVDGLLLMAALLAAAGLYVQSRPRLDGLGAFWLPLLTLLLAWAVFASAWAYRPFRLDTLHPVWRFVHLAGVYVGTLGCGVAAGAGAMYLFVSRGLKRKRNPRAMTRLASLERLERLVVHAAAVGFALLTVGLVSGVVILRDEAEVLGPRWYASPKVLLAVGAWGVYALVMNVRFAATFRGRRAAWLAIGGFGLLLAVYGVVTAVPPRSGAAIGGGAG